MIETTVRERNIPGLTGRAILAYSNRNGIAIDSTLSLNMTEPLLAYSYRNGTAIDSALSLHMAEPLPHPLWNESEAAKELEDMLFTRDVNDHQDESVALITDEDDIVRYIMVGTQATRLDKNTGEEDALLWAMNNISSTKTANPLIGSAVAQSRILGWPLDTTMEGTVDMPKTPPTTWNYSGPVVYSPEETIDNSEDSRPGPNLGSEETAVIRAEKGQVIEIVFQNARALNGVAEFHPWHMHGHSFWVIGRGEGIYDPESDIDSYNLRNPLLRDTVTLWPLGWVAVRFVANNAGVWSIHCHLTSHLVMGMAFNLITDPNEIGDPSDSVKFCNSASLDPPQSKKNEIDSTASLSDSAASYSFHKNLCISAIAIATSLPQDFAFVIPQQKSIVLETDLGELNLLGSSTVQSGGIYDPADVQIIDRLGTSEADNFADGINGFFNFDSEDKIRGQFAGQRQPKFIPQKDPGFFLNGECVATQVRGALILGHSCLLNLCLGGGGYNCLAIYAGSKFVFNPLEQVLESPTTFSFGDNNPGSIVPSLPPSYPGTIIGGTGLFVGAVGYVDVTTITGSTLTPANNFDELNDDEDSSIIKARYPQAGYITQKINVVTNVPLPVAP
ncbi:Cu-oxidase_2-domain-containing protein [Fragilariopsis cylindrus CCMP1102]|uniref:Cu-oxidase_2-domain-containing protein n=1 Tax=Fragilariopsis cylindrus CCMP1102 TaxID=635003 RepID=A0A1E7FTQ6_9STRA|nr:Cu-oxidase_2-domain-containing protein [Fragilariopsis cylindrus CCMP1102]|eukprot:OEU21548.1 Cu-oxidase_2-domain-containing protein [Fragilariopsis cylindrus CCMP1102]